MDMVVSFCILGVYNMANGLEHIAKILKELNEELKLDNDKWEQAQNGRSNVLPTSDARTGDARICCGKCKGECE
jgi:hypothetical protein